MIFQLAAGVLFGLTIPTVFAILWGLQNEGYNTLSFLVYPGWESWLTIGLGVALATIIVATRRHGLRMIAVARQRVCLIATVSTFLLSSAILILVSVDEYPLRKFFTYLVAPRLFTAWLAAACVALVIGSRLISRRAA